MTMESQRRPSARRRGERAPVAAHVPQEGCQRRRYRAGLRIHVAACDFPTADDLNLASEHTVRHSKIRYPCPLWVISGHVQCKRACPLYPRKRHQTRHHGMSALGQKRTSRACRGFRRTRQSLTPSSRRASISPTEKTWRGSWTLIQRHQTCCVAGPRARPWIALKPDRWALGPKSFKPPTQDARSGNTVPSTGFRDGQQSRACHCGRPLLPRRDCSWCWC